MAEGTALEMRRTSDRTVGSNPTLSANKKSRIERLFLLVERVLSRQKKTAVFLSLRDTAFSFGEQLYDKLLHFYDDFLSDKIPDRSRHARFFNFSLLK